MKFSLPRLLTALLLGGFVAWLIAFRPFSADRPTERVFLELVAASPGDGTLVLRLDDGHGYPDDRPSELAVKIHRSGGLQPVLVPVPPGRVRGLKLTVFGTPALALKSARLENAHGQTLADLPLASLRTPPETSANVKSGATVLAGAALGQASFEFEFRPASPLQIPTGNEPLWWEVLATWLAASAVFALLGALFAGRLPGDRLSAVRTALTSAAQRQPTLTLAVVALAAAIVSCFPVVFCGKSFVSPNTSAMLLYFGTPTLPGAPVEPLEDVKGSDVACVFWCDIPFTAMVNRALFQDHELPLWNRFDACGVPLLGEAQSMVGDPVGLIPLLAKSAWWAWDLKFLLAKTLFALGLGLCAYQATRSLGVSAMVSASSAWIGFFAYRFDHPAFFSVSYAPWILLPWLVLRENRSRGRILLCAAGLILADWAELNSGTAKEASMLLLCLNAAGLLALLLSSPSTSDDAAQSRHSSFVIRHFRAGLGRAVPLLWASFLFLLISAPLWLVFLDALSRCITIYDTPKALQLPPGLALGFFEGLFTQDVARLEIHHHPSLNLLFLAGLLWLIVSGAWRGNRLVFALALAAIPPAALVFGAVPASWIMATPFIRNIIHIHNTFGCVLLILLALLGAIGLRGAWEHALSKKWTAVWLRMLAAMAVLLAAYLWFRFTLPATPGGLFNFSRTLPSRFFLVYAPAALLAAALFPCALRFIRKGGALGWVLAALCLFTIHFRHGMYVETAFDPYVMNPRTGYDLNAQSMALDRVQRRLTEPFRTTGLSGVLSPGYPAQLGIEALGGADALQNRYYDELCHAAKLAQVDWRLIVPEGTASDRKPLYDLLNLRFYLREPSPRPAPAGLQIASRADLDILESPDAWPRAFFTDRIRSYATAEEFIDLIKKGDGKPLAAFQGATAPRLTPGDHIVPARDYHQTTNTVSFLVHAPGPGVAVLGEAFEQDNFRVTINGVPATYFRVNHAFKGVELPAAGDYRIVFSYWPKVLTPALWLAAAGLLLGALSAGWLLRRPALAIPAPALSSATTA